MKRLLSWLLVLVMVVGLLPMSAFAADDDWEVKDEDWDIIVEFGGELNPIDLTADLRADMTATVTVPAGKIYYYTANGIANGMEMAITGLDPVICNVAPGAAYTWSIDNREGETDAEYVITISFPEGHMENPKVIEEMSWYSDEVTQAAGDSDGFFYTYTAPADGVVTMYFGAEYDDEGNVIEDTVRDIMVTNMNTYAQYSLLNDGVDNYGLELQIPVAAGDVLSINTCYVADAAGNSYPAATYSWTGNFAYPAGSEQNPIAIEWAWNDDGTTATATVNAEADAYYTGIAGMILTANGEEVAMDETGKFQLSAGTYELVLSTPVGAYNNPEVIENIDGYTSEKHLDVDGSYYYIWTATEDGTVTLDVTDGANITVDKLTYTEDSEWPISEQFILAEPEIDENWNYTGWTVAENLVIDVVAGQQLKIQVNGLTDWSDWTVPAIDYTLTGSFQKAAVYSFASTGGIAPFLSLEDEVFLMIGFDLYKDGTKITADTITDEILANFGVAVWAVENKPATDDEHTVENADYCLSDAYWHTSNKRITLRTAGIPAKNMGDAISFRPFYKNADGTYVYGRIIASYSPRAYAESNANKASNAANFRAMMVALMNYGAAAQQYFGYKTDDLMNASWTDEQKASTWDESMVRSEYPTDKADASWVRDSSKITSRTANLTLEGAITVNLYAKTSFTVAKATAYYWTEAQYNNVDALTLDNASSVEVIESVDDQGRWTAGYDGVAAKDLFNTVYSMIVFEDTDGNVHYTGVVAYSAERYAYTNRSKTDAAAELARRLACYSVAAQNYFFGSV